MSKIECLDDLEQAAKNSLTENVFRYYSSGADYMVTVRDNRDAFNRYKVLPRILRNVSKRDLSTTILGHRIAFPVGISPTAAHILAHPEGEIATAKGAASLNVAYCQSSSSTRSLAEIAENAPDCLRFLQLNHSMEKKDFFKIFKEAERHGYHAVCITVDIGVLGKRKSLNRLNLNALPDHIGFKVYEILEEYRNKKPVEAVQKIMAIKNLAYDWNHIAWMKKHTSLKIVLKGILTAADALNAVSCGVDAIIVSNHGGRQLDTTPATIDVLQEVVRAVNGKLEVYMDGGVRTGTDVFKALALGARSVFIGRPVVYGLAYNGQKGVELVLNILKEELENVMILSGCSTIKDIDSSHVRHCSQFPCKL